MNIEKELKSVVTTGEVDIGSERTLKNARQGTGKLIVMASNMQAETRSDIESYAKLSSIPVYVFKGSSTELGNVCKKPFPVAAMTIHESGDSDILDLAEEKK